MEIEEISKTVTLIRTGLREKVEPLEKVLVYRPAFNVDFYRESLIHRFLDLSESSVFLLNRKQYISSLVTTRASLETLSVIAYLSIKLEQLQNDRNLEGFLHHTHQLTFGWRGDDEFPEIINVLTCVDKLSKKVDPGFRDIYDKLSESCHPNYTGVVGTYATPNHDSKEVNIDIKESVPDRSNTIVTSSLGMSLIAFEHFQGEFENRINSLIDICVEYHEKGKLKAVFYNVT